MGAKYDSATSCDYRRAAAEVSTPRANLGAQLVCHYNRTVARNGRETSTANRVGRLRQGVRELAQKARVLLEHEPMTEMSRMQRLVARNLRVIFLVFRWDVYVRLNLHAKALTYDTLLALVPLLAVLFSVFRGFGGLDKLAPQLQQIIVRNLAGAPEVQQVIGEYVNRFVANVNTGAVGAVSIVILVWSVLSLLGYIEDSFNAIFGTKVQRPLALRLLTYWAVLTLGPVLLGASLALTAALQTTGIAEVVSRVGPVRGALIAVTPLLVTWLGFTTLYLVVPNTRVRIGAALLAALVAGSMWNAAKYGYAIYAKNALTLQNIYGSLSAIPLFILWVYVSWLLVLFGTQLTFAFQNAASYRREDATLDVGQAYRERAACRLLLAVARNYYAGGGPTDRALAGDALGIPRRLVDSLVIELVGGAFVLETEPQGGLVPATDLANITPARVLEHMRRSAVALPTDTDDPAVTRLETLLTQVDDERSQLAGAVSFRELAADATVRVGAPKSE